MLGARRQRPGWLTSAAALIVCLPLLILPVSSTEPACEDWEKYDAGTSACVAQACDRDHSDLGPGNEKCCNRPGEPCQFAQGDCDIDSHCVNNLTCGSNNCPWGGSDDCCGCKDWEIYDDASQSCLPQACDRDHSDLGPGNEKCCNRPGEPCQFAQGDCDIDSHCVNNLACGSNNCPWGGSDDCCGCKDWEIYDNASQSCLPQACDRNHSDLGPGNEMCCNRPGEPCQFAQGDCDIDSHCINNLTCGSNNCPWGGSDDCCGCKDWEIYDDASQSCLPQACDRNHSDLGPGNEMCCNRPGEPCQFAQGDCDIDSHCVNNLACGSNNCPWGGSDDCCECKDWEIYDDASQSCLPQACDRNHSDLGPGNEMCCNRPGEPCQFAQGDCDIDSHCINNLICGSNNCPWGGSDDCCECEDWELYDAATKSCVPLPCNGSHPDLGPGNEQCCNRPGLPCDFGEGDCDIADHCVNNLRCGSNNCPWGGSDDCCECADWEVYDPICQSCLPQTCDATHPDLDAGNEMCCNRPGEPCHFAEGDCDIDAHCINNLKCGSNNCPWGGSDDCCECKDWEVYDNETQFCISQVCDATHPDLGPGNEMCCNRPGLPCHFAEGDCDIDAHCINNLNCGSNNCPWGGSDDCCGCADWEVYNNETETCVPQVCDATHPDLGPGNEKCCNRPGLPCHVAEGDCDIDAHCVNNLRCGSNNCPWGGSDDCCGCADWEVYNNETETCLPQVCDDTHPDLDAGNEMCCNRPGLPCHFAEGDCDIDAHCINNLNCGSNNCPWGGSDDCCGCADWEVYDNETETCVPQACDITHPNLGSGNEKCCNRPGVPCLENQGDCDIDDHCANNLICGSNNCPWGGSDDCCKCPEGLEYNEACQSCLNAGAECATPVPETCSDLSPPGCCYGQCIVSEGECTDDSDCVGNLVCMDSPKICGCADGLVPRFGGAACYTDSQSCTESAAWPTDCCHGQCLEGQGSCNQDADCVGNLICGTGNCDDGSASNCCMCAEGLLTDPSGAACYVDPLPCDENRADREGCCHGQCVDGQGYCSSNSDCAGNLICGTSNCALGNGNCCECAPGWALDPDSNSNNCYNPQPCDVDHPVHEYCCQGQCLHGHGNCQTNSDCAGNLVCGENNCVDDFGTNKCCECADGWELDTTRDGDACYNPQPCDASFSPVGENDCCQGQCRVNEGDCDSDSDCAGNLVCSPGSCAWGEGDCCACPNGFEPEWHGLGCFNPQIVPACRGGGERVTGAGFLGEYFDGNFGELKLSRFDEVIDFDFEESGPEDTDDSLPVGVDDFSIKWTGYFAVAVPGEYVFKVGSTDDVKVWINPASEFPTSAPDISHTGARTYGEDQSAPVSLSPSVTHRVVMTAVENSGPARFSLKVLLPGESTFKLLGTDVPVHSGVCEPPSPESLATSCGVPGFLGQYYHGSPPGEDAAEDGEKILERVDSSIDFDSTANAPDGLRADDIMIKWTGMFKALATGEYWFEAGSTDGVRIYIDGVLHLGYWNDRDYGTTSGTVFLIEGVHQVIMEVYKHDGDGKFTLRWRPPYARYLSTLADDFVFVGCCDFDPPCGETTAGTAPWAELVETSTTPSTTPQCEFQCIAGHQPTITISDYGLFDPECEPCPVGTYKDAVGNYACDGVCPSPTSTETYEGTATGLTQESDCDPTCKAGYYENPPGSEICEKTPAGKYKPTIGDAEGPDCPPPGVGETYATTSPGLTAVGQCDPVCAQGYFEDGEDNCVECLPGSYKAVPGDQNCTACPNEDTGETFETTEDGLTTQTQCDPVCEAGWYEETLEECSQCASGTWKSAVGDQACSNCPAPKDATETYDSTPIGLTAEGQCRTVCSPGYYRSDGDCVLCPLGRYKSVPGDAAGLCMECTTDRDPAVSTQSNSTKVDNSHWTYDTSAPATSADVCTYACDGGYGGFNCQLCSAGSWATGAGDKWTSCERCASQTPSLLKPPNSHWRYDGSDPTEQDSEAEACDYVCNGAYADEQTGGYNSGFACDKHPLCSAGQFYNSRQSLGALQVNGSCWEYYPSSLPFTEARKQCTDKGGDLAEIAFEADEGVFVIARETQAWIADGSVEMTWLSFSDRFSESVWMGLNGENFPAFAYRNWASGQPSDAADPNGADCAVMGSQDQWFAVPCDGVRPYVCAKPRAPFYYEQCPETDLCHADAYCIVVAGSPVCTCPEGYWGDGVGETGCSKDGWSVRFNIYLDAAASVTLTPSSGSVKNMRGKLFFWDVLRDEYASLLTPEGFRTGGANTAPPANTASEVTEARRSLPAGFLFSMEHSVTDVTDLTDGYILSSVPAGTQYMLTVNAVFGDRDEAEAALEELLFNLQGNHSWVGATGPTYPTVFGVTLTPDRYPLPPRLYRWVAQSTAAPQDIAATGMTVQTVYFEPSCEQSGCWVVNILFTLGEDNFNTFFLPRAVGDDALSYDFDYDVTDATWGQSPEDTFQPANFPCNTFDYDPEAPRTGFSPINAPIEVTACCMPEFLGMYRPIESFATIVTDSGITKEACDAGIVKTFERPDWNPPPTPGPAAYTGPEVNCTEMLSATAPDVSGASNLRCFAPAGRAGQISHAYTAGDEMAWLLSADTNAGAGRAMEVKVDFFETVADADFISFYECLTPDCASANPIAKGSGAYNKFSVTSCSGYLLVTLQSSVSSTPRAGFVASFYELPTCPYTGNTRKSLRAPTDGTATDPNRVAGSVINVVPNPGNQLFGYFSGLNHSHIEFESVVDPYIGQLTANVFLDEVELRRFAGMLRGTVGVEHTVDTYIGLANFKPTGLDFIDPFATQVAIHLEKTSFFSVSTHGVNDYTFLEYVNLRLITIYTEDTDFSGESESNQSFVRTDSSGAAQYVQVTFTVGDKYGVNENSGLIPLDSVRAGKGTFFRSVELAGGLHHKCLEYTESPANELTADKVLAFNTSLDQECAPGASMCVSPAAIPDQFAVFNIPLGIDFFDAAAQDLSNNIFVSMVISAVDNFARAASTNPNAGEAPWQMKTTLTASIPVVAGGLNIFCDGLTGKTDLKDVAKAHIVVGSAVNVTELSRLRILRDIASTQLAVEGPQEINTDSIESGLMTLVIEGDSAYFDLPGRTEVSVELEDLITIHIMEDDGTGGTNSMVTQVLEWVSAAADDNSDANGLITDGYPLNDAFFFRVDRSSQRAHLEPSTTLLGACPWNPRRPDSGNMPLITCITRRDVQNRGYPARTGGESTAMEICKAASPHTDPCDDDYASGCCGGLSYTSGAAPSDDESKFFGTILGQSDYSYQLAVDFAKTIDAEFSLNGRYVRAFWVNPGYEWTPTQSGGASIFSLSQKIFLYALISLDENIATDTGTMGPSPSFSRRRMLLSTDALEAQGTGGASGSAAVRFQVSPQTMLARAFGVPDDRVATFEVEVQLSKAEACLATEQLQSALRLKFEDALATAASEIRSVQVAALTVDLGDEQCDSGTARRRSARHLLADLSSATATTQMVVVFAPGGRAVFNDAAFAAMPGINSVQPSGDLSPKIAIDSEFHRDSTPSPVDVGSDDESSSSSNTALIAGVSGGVGALLLILGGAVFFVRSRRHSDVPSVQAINPADLKATLAADV